MTNPGSEEVAGLAPELAGAKEGTGEVPLLSAGERFTSYDLAAFEVPSGREENWRFTPMRRLRGLHDGSAVIDPEVLWNCTSCGACVQQCPVDIEIHVYNRKKYINKL